QVRIGIWDFNSDPGLVWDRPRIVILARSSASFRSMVAALIIINNSAWASVTVISLSRRSIGTKTGIITASSLPAGARSAAQQVINGSNRSGPYVGVRPGRGLTTLSTSALRIAQGCSGVVAVPAGQLEDLIE